ncbi:hypothetical protein DB345_01820 [Spartobacteria bacterium LR76]|nr:hypothetical protein DB345_01820 [Spartobacteria bacterium LR76]
MKISFAAIVSVCLSLTTSLALEVVNEQCGNVLAHQFECTERGELFKSPLAGFIALKLSGDQVNHYPLNKILDITEQSYGVYIQFENERMKNGGGFMATTIFIPTKVMEPKETIALIKSCQ